MGGARGRSGGRRSAPWHPAGDDRDADSRGGRADRRHRRRGPRSAPRSDRPVEGRPPRRGDPRHLRVLPDAGPHHPRADHASAASRSSPWKPTGPMPRGSIATCVTAPRCRRAKPPSAASRPGCGETPRSTTSSNGCDPGTRTGPTPRSRAGFYGLDLYSLFTSIAAVLRYLDEVDPDTAALARRRYACLSPWERDPAVYGRAALTGRYRTCEEPVTRMLRDMMERRLDYAVHDGERFLDAAQNARLVANAERYYRVMYYGQVDSWNLRDRHMFDTLDTASHVPRARGQGRRLGAQLPRRQRRRHRDGRPRRVQRGPALPRAVRPGGLPRWGSGPTTEPSPRRGTGTRRCRS